jgi:Protein of unknown function (DUF3047)
MPSIEHQRLSRRTLLLATLLASSPEVFADEPSGGARSNPGGAKNAMPFSTQAPKDVSATIPLFSALKIGGELSGWTFQPLRGVRKTTQYSLVGDPEVSQPVVEARAVAAAAALGVRLDLDPKQFHKLRFKWKIANLIESSDPRVKEGDDYAARVYVTFATDPARASFRERTENAFFRTLYGETPPRAALSYIFTHKAKLGDVIVSPFSSRVRKIVVDADPASVGKWKSFERDVYADYKRAFGDEPTHISGVAIMVDTDNTGESASARFADITLTEK